MVKITPSDKIDKLQQTMLQESFTFKSKVWTNTGIKSTWHFVNIPVNMGVEIKNLFAHSRHGWGSLPVTVTLGTSAWKTSIFPDKKTGSFVLPLKASVRKEERVVEGDEVTIQIVIRD